MKGFVNVLLLVLIVILLGVIGVLCKDYMPFGFTEIGQLSARPQSFEGKQVKVKGKVVGTLKVPFIESKSYVLDDGTGEVTVTTNFALPTKGDKVALVAVGNSAAIIGGDSIGFRLQEIEKLPDFTLLFDR